MVSLFSDGGLHPLLISTPRETTLRDSVVRRQVVMEKTTRIRRFVTRHVYTYGRVWLILLVS